jgi:hypothetical protein
MTTTTQGSRPGWLAAARLVAWLGALAPLGLGCSSDAASVSTDAGADAPAGSDGAGDATSDAATDASDAAALPACASLTTPL